MHAHSQKELTRYNLEQLFTWQPVTVVAPHVALYTNVHIMQHHHRHTYSCKTIEVAAHLSILIVTLYVFTKIK